MTTPGEFLDSLRGRDLRATVSATGRLRIEPRSRLTDAERAYLSGHASAVVRTLVARRALDEAVRKREAADEAAICEQVAESERRAAAHRARIRREAMADWSAEKVAALVDEGALTAEDVAEWREAVAEQERRVRLQVGAAVLSAAGLTVRLIE
jgi:hypothetical protein